MKKALVTTLAVAMILGGLFFSAPKEANAQNLFGGLVLWTFFCNCSGNYLLYISPPNGGFFSYYPGTQQFLNFNLPKSGVWTLGLYNPGGACLIHVGTGCSSFIHPQGTITPITGTSQ